MPSRTSRLSSAGLVIALLPFMASSAIAATITYDEAVDGDLPSTEWAPFELGMGVNSITGTFGNGTSTLFDGDAARRRFRRAEARRAGEYVAPTCDDTCSVLTAVGSVYCRHERSTHQTDARTAKPLLRRCGLLRGASG